jgi:transposase InsO family protein
MSLLTIQQYCNFKGISERHYYRLKKEGSITTIPGTNYVYTTEQMLQFTDKDKKFILESKIAKWNSLLKNAHNIYKQHSKPTKATTQIIHLIETEVSFLKKIGFIIKGFDRRSLQLKVSKGRVERKSREEPKPIRNKVVASAFNKAVELIFSLNMQRAISSVNEAVDRAIHYAKTDEYYWEVAACEKYIYTLRRQIKRAMKQMGFKTLHEFLNHYNQFRKKLAYVKGAFTDDIGFNDVYSLDDHKFDVAGAKVFNPHTGKLEQKQVWSWFVVEMKTLMPLGYMIKTSPFTEEDILRLLMRVFRQYGKPNQKVIMDNGLASSERVLTFLERCGIVHEVQDPYCPTQKSPNERLYGLVKNEQDVYSHDFVGSNHPAEGRHAGRQLSPEETLRIIETAQKEYDNYVNGYLIDRPRTRNIKSIPPSLLDNSKRVSIRRLYDFYYQHHTPQLVTDKELRYAYMKYDKTTSFNKFYITFKKEVYIPISDFSLVLNDPAYKFTIAYNPADMNIIDLYSSQDITDALTGEFIARGQYVCTLESLASLDADEKKRRVAIYNKKINKAMKELAANFRSMFAVNKDIANAVVGDQGLINVAKEQTLAVEKLIKHHVPARQIEIDLDKAAALNGNEETIDQDKAFSEESIEKLNTINVDEDL